MSVQTLYTAATGMDAMQTKLDVIANNLANVNTTGYKRERPNFEDLFYRHEVMPGSQDANGGITPTGTSIGLGTRVASVQSEFGQGAFRMTNNALDLAIVGRGFFQVRNPDNTIVYTRAGNFSRNANGDIVMGSAGNARPLEPNINIPQDAVDVTVSIDGVVQYTTNGNSAQQTAGQIQLASFVNPEGLLRLGDNVYSQTDASGTGQIGTPGQNELGVVRMNTLEASNVEPVQELIDLITTQRSFELNSQAVKVGDEILQLVANLRRA